LGSLPGHRRRANGKDAKTGNVGVSFTGDGGSNQGLVFEAINMAVVLQLPAVFIFENNGYGEGTGHDYAVGGRDIARRAAGFGLPAVTVDGTDFFAVYEATSEAVKRAREGGGPSVIEAKAFRWHGHFEGDPALYRAEGEVQRLREQHEDFSPLRSSNISPRKNWRRLTRK
jgi:pyruvate dehydrogenase E1 component alpha subunit